MTSLFAVYTSHGKCIGYCSAKCYGAKLDGTSDNPCACICGGKNHGMGEAQACKNYQRGIGMQPGDLQAFAKCRGLDAKKLTIVDRLRVDRKHAAQRALAQLAPKKPLPLFAYGSLGHRKSSEGAQRRRG
jgi:hypothetical protein